MNWPIDKLCRLNGARPSKRDRWKAFYSIFRAASRNDPMFFAQDCFRILLEGDEADWLRLVTGPGDYYENLAYMPIGIRRQMVEKSSSHRRAVKLLGAIFAEP